MRVRIARKIINSSFTLLALNASLANASICGVRHGVIYEALIEVKGFLAQSFPVTPKAPVLSQLFRSLT